MSGIRFRGRAASTSTGVSASLYTSPSRTPLTRIPPVPFEPLFRDPPAPLPSDLTESHHPEALSQIPPDEHMTATDRPDTPPIPDPEVIAQVEDLQRQVSTALCERDEARANGEKSKDALEQEKSRAVELERALTEIGKANAAREATQAEKIRGHKAENRRLEDDIVRYHESIRAKGNEVAAAWKRVDSVEETLKYRSKQEEALQTKLDDAQEEIEALEEAASDRDRLYRRDLQGAEARRIKAEQEVKKLEGRLDISDQDRASLAQELELLQQGLEKARSEATASQAQVNALTTNEAGHNVGRILTAIEEQKRLERELKVMRDRRDSDRAELHAEYEIRIRGLQRKVSEGKEAEKAKDAEITRLEEICDVHSEARHQLEVDIEAETSTRKALQIEVGRLQLALEVSETKADGLSDHTETEPDAAASIARMIELEVLNAGLEAQLSQQSADLQDNESLARALADTNRLLSNRLSTVSQALVAEKEANNDHQKWRDHLERIRTGLETSLDTSEAKNRRDDTELSNRASRIAALEAELFRANQARQAAQNEVDRLHMENDELQGRVNGLEEKAYERQPNTSQLMRDLDKLRSWNATHEAAATRYHFEKTRYRSERDALRSAKTEADGRISDLERSIQAKDEDLQFQQKRIDELEERHETAKTTISKNEADMEKVKVQYRVLWTDMTDSKKTIAELQEHIQALKSASNAVTTPIPTPVEGMNQSDHSQSQEKGEPEQFEDQKMEKSEADLTPDELRLGASKVEAENAMLRAVVLAGKATIDTVDIKSTPTPNNDEISVRAEHADLRTRVDQQVEYNETLVRQIRDLEQVLDSYHPDWRDLE